ncbi:uncharacterized protein FYW47_000214 [Aplochiton taeniatus]
MDLGTRSDTRAINTPPVTATVSHLRVPQNCFTGVSLLAYDPESDIVQCSFSGNDTYPNITLNQDKCTLQRKGKVNIGTHVFELVLEDFSAKDVTLQYVDGTSVVRTAFNQSSSNNSTPFSKVPLQFALEILPPIPNCMIGHVVPLLLPPTPSQGDVHHAAVGQQYQLKLAAQASHSTVYDFQISGPSNMTKTFQKGQFGKVEATLSWTPQQSDLQRLVPVCFTAETNESQSEMRCINLLVSSTLALKGQAEVTCNGNRMTILLNKDSLTGIDKNWLQLRDPTCSLTSNDTYIMGTVSLNTCGTVLEYPKNIQVSTQFQLQDNDYVFTESSFGTFGYSFNMFKNNTFSQKIDPNSYPVEVKLLQTIYLGINAESALSKVTLFVESCKATPDEDPKNSIFYTLIENG